MTVETDLESAFVACCKEIGGNRYASPNPTDLSEYVFKLLDLATSYEAMAVTLQYCWNKAPALKSAIKNLLESEEGS